MNILDVKMQKNDARAETIKDYLKEILMNVWIEEESFSGKRPFGNSGWKHDIYKSLAAEGIIEAECHNQGDSIYYEYNREAMNKADKLIEEAIRNI